MAVLYRVLILFYLLLPELALANVTISTGTGDITGYALNGGNPNFIAQPWVADLTGTADSVDVYVAYIDSSFNDDATYCVQADSSGLPSGSDLGCGSVANASLSSVPGHFNVAFGTPVSISNGVTYWLIHRSSGAVHAYPRGLDGRGQSPASGSHVKWWDGSNWNDADYTLYGVVYTSAPPPLPPPPPPPSGPPPPPPDTWAGPGSATSTPNGVIMHAETIMGVTFALMMTIFVYFFVAMFRPAR